MSVLIIGRPLDSPYSISFAAAANDCEALAVRVFSNVGQDAVPYRTVASAAWLVRLGAMLAVS